MSRYLMIRHVAPLALAASILAGCSSDSSTDPNGPGNPDSCTITMTGARSQPLACSGLSASAGQAGGDDNTLFGLQGTGSTDTLDVAIGLTGTPVVKTYTSGTDADPTVLLITPVGGWATGFGEGSLSLTFTSVKAKDAGAGRTTWEVHGTLTMTLAEETGGDSLGPVSVTVKF